MNISVFGLGRLGLPFAVWLASKGHEVMGVDTNPDTIEALTEGKCPIQETGLPKLLKSVGGMFKIPMISEQAARDSEVVFIVVPTPSTETGAFSLEYVLGAVDVIGKVMAKDGTYRLIVVVSTVMPGHMEQVRAKLETASGKQCGPDFGLCYNPEFIALGSVLHDLRHPDFVLIGESDVKAGDMLASFYPSQKMVRTNFVNAEIAKLAINCYITTKITFANIIGHAVQNIPGADVDAITGAMGQDSRIGPKYLKAGLPYGGPCFPRDNRALSAAFGSETLLPVDEKNKLLTLALLEFVERRLQKEQSVAWLGLAYKARTNVTEESASLKVGAALLKAGWRMYLGPLPVDIHEYRSAVQQIVAEADSVVIAMPEPAYKDLDYGDKPVVDCWRLLRDKPPKNWIPMGIGPADA